MACAKDCCSRVSARLKASAIPCCWQPKCQGRRKPVSLRIANCLINGLPRFFATMLLKRNVFGKPHVILEMSPGAQIQTFVQSAGLSWGCTVIGSVLPGQNGNYWGKRFIPALEEGVVFVPVAGSWHATRRRGGPAAGDWQCDWGSGLAEERVIRWNRRGFAKPMAGWKLSWRQIYATFTAMLSQSDMCNSLKCWIWKLYWLPNKTCDYPQLTRVIIILSSYS